MLKNVDWSKWGPLTVIVVGLTLIVAVFIAIYLIITQPSTAAIIGFLKALGEFAAATGLIGLGHGILGRSTPAPGERPIAAADVVQDPEVERAKADVPDEAEFRQIPPLESAVHPDPPSAPASTTITPGA